MEMKVQKKVLNSEPNYFLNGKFCFGVGSNRKVSNAAFARLSLFPAPQRGAESGPSRPTMILIGAPIPHADPPPAGFPNVPLPGTPYF